MKKIAVIFFTLAAFISGSPATAEVASSGVDWPPPHQSIGKALGVTIQDDFSQGMVNRLSIPTKGVQPFCTSLDDSACAKHTSIGWWILRILPPCDDTNSQDDCVEGLSLTKDYVTKVASLVDRIQERTWVADAKRGLPIAGAQGLWSNPFSSNPADKFYVNVFGDLHQANGNSGPFELSDFFASVTSTNSDAVNTPHSCIWIQGSMCGRRIAFDPDVVISLTLHLHPALTGWLGGRLDSPEVKVSKINSSVNRITISAKPVNVNMVQARVPFSSAPKSVIDFMYKPNDGCPIDECDISIESSGDLVFDYLEKWKPVTKDVSTATIPYWSVSRSSITTYSPCIKNGFVGLVTTNATAYQQAMPKLDGSDLTYKVAGLHFNPDGSTPAMGTYDMLLRSDVARCIYSFSSAPIKATVSITNGSDVQEVATETIGESNGWLHLSARNFHFSSDSIKIRLTQDGQKLLTCQKGKAQKIVRGKIPKCPTGYKKVA